MTDAEIRLELVRLVLKEVGHSSLLCDTDGVLVAVEKLRRYVTPLPMLSIYVSDFGNLYLEGEVASSLMAHEEAVKAHLAQLFVAGSTPKEMQEELPGWMMSKGLL